MKKRKGEKKNRQTEEEKHQKCEKNKRTHRDQREEGTRILLCLGGANPSCGMLRAARVIHVHIEKRICNKKLT